MTIAGLRGELASDPRSLALCARDAGGLVSLPPRAVLRPRSAEDVALAVRACHRIGIKLVPRGTGHTIFGQAQVEGGLVIEMGSLDQLHDLTPEHAIVDAGSSWRKLLLQTTAVGRTPPVLTGFQGLSIGGTLSVGGISGVSYRRGAQIDHVMELEVVTGRGDIVTCSPTSNRELFEGVLGGCGHLGIIVRATLPLLPAPTHARVSVLSYAAFGPFLRDMRALVAREGLEGVSGTLWLHPHQPTRYELNAVSFYTPPRAPDTATLLDGIGADAERSTSDLLYLDYLLHVDRLLDGLASTGGWSERAHPWFDVFLPDAALEPYLSEVLSGLDATRDVGPPELGSLGQLHLFPLLTRHLTRRSLRVPAGGLVFLFDILTAAHVARTDAAYPREMLERNRRLFLRARERGGIPYAISAIPQTSAERREQAGGRLQELERLKTTYDPHGVLRELM